MESRFGHDFLRVQVHTGSFAASSANALGAQAYTMGHHIVFANRRYQPHTRAGQALLAHELTHVVQQQTFYRQPVATQNQLEQEADTNAARVSGGQAAGAISAGVAGVQLRSIQRFEGTPLGQLTVTSNMGSYSQDLVAELEVVPPLEDPAVFGGFDTQNAALGAAARHPTITAVIQDRDGMFHVFDTRFPRISQEPGAHYQIVPYQLANAQFIQWVNVSLQEPDQQIWELRHGEAEALYRRYQSAQGEERPRLRQAASEAYVGLMMQALEVPRDQIYIVPAGGSAQPGLINFDIDLERANAEAGIAGSLPATREGDAPSVTLTLGRGSIHRGGSGSVTRRAYVLTQMTHRHESAHVEHAQLAIALRQQWRESGGTTTFEAWLQEQRRRRCISRLDHDLALEQVQGGEHATQTVAYLQGFITGYQQLPADGPELVLFAQLIGMANHWAWTGHTLNDRTITALYNYYCRVMDEPHQ